MHGRRNPFVAQEGLLPMLIAASATVFVVRYANPWYAVLPVLLFVLLYLVFRDPRRTGPPAALGVVSPVDGEVLEVSQLQEGALDEPAHRILIQIDALGTYTARSPVEGKIMDLGKKALWVQTDEGDNVVLAFSGYRFGLPPKSFVRFGERLGQGQRCACLRLTRLAEVQLPVAGTLDVEPGSRVLAGVDLLGSVPNPR